MKIKDLPWGSTFYETGNLKFDTYQEHAMDELSQNVMDDELIPMLVDHIAHPDLAQHIYGYCSYDGKLYIGLGTNETKTEIIHIKYN